MRSLDVVFGRTDLGTVGIEEEVLLVDPRTWRPSPVAAIVVADAEHPSVKTELPAAQVELMTRPHTDPDAAVAELADARRRLVAACADEVAPVAAAVHPLATGPAAVTASPRADALVATYGESAARQLVGALQVHLGLGTADRTLAVYNALRSHLPEIAALAAAAPFHEGRDTGLASVRPLVAGLLPRQGVPPALTGWDHFAEELAWGRRSGFVPEPGVWWWELRPHPRYGTLEVRVPDVQPTVAATRAVVTTVHALALHLARRHDEGERLPTHPSWRIAENRWAALRHGVHGTLAHLTTGETEDTTQRLHRLLDRIEEDAVGDLAPARALLGAPTADSLRAAGLDGALPWLAEAFEP